MELNALTSKDRIWLATLVLIGLEALYLTFLLVQADSYIWFGHRSTVGGIDWAALASRFPVAERWAGRLEVVCYWGAIVLLVLRRKLFVGFYLAAIVLRFYFWLRFVSLPEFPALPGYGVMVNEMLAGALIYLGWKHGVYR